ncbi:hypothetical protein [Scytonema sp. HK-05]|nr:hypothetical protein [Scytonema sp. HK-05]
MSDFSRFTSFRLFVGIYKSMGGTIHRISHFNPDMPVLTPVML